MLIKIIKKTIFAMFLLYSFNVVAVKFGIIIPINYVTILLTTIFDIPAMILLIFSLILIF